MRNSSKTDRKERDPYEAEDESKPALDQVFTVRLRAVFFVRFWVLSSLTH